MTDEPTPRVSHEAVTTPAGITTTCPQCGVSLDALTTACGRCGAVITGGGHNGERAERVRKRLQAQIGNAYELGALIGRGGMGIVFRAREVALDREVALKVLAFDPVLNPEAFTRFEREAKLAARLDHPNIVPIFAVGQGDGAAFYTMRFVRGGSLEALVVDKGPLSEDRALPLLREVASALDFAHAQGIVHRDIKPANILLSESGHAMVADFGIARAFSGDSATSTSGSHTGVVGSPAYMAPEQWRGEKPDGRADQYALGVLAFELMSGVRPFRDVSMQELLRMHLGEEPPALDSVRKGLPPRIGGAIRRAMSKNPADRFPSVSAFVGALAGESSVGGNQRVAAARVPGRTSGERSRQWLGNSLAALLVLVAAAVGLDAWRKSRHAEPVVAPPVPVVAAAPAPNTDTLAERLARELDETRKIALDAQRRAERAETMQRQGARVPAPMPVGHVAVGVRGGAPRLLIDGKEAAPSTPAFIEVPTGRHIVQVEITGAWYLAAQYVIDVSQGDTSKLQFTDVRSGNRNFSPQAPPPSSLDAQGGPQPGQKSRYPRGRSADSTVAGSPSGVGALRQPRQGDGAFAHPYYLPSRVWQAMSPQEQSMLRARWDRLTPDQQMHALQDMQRRDSAGVAYLRRNPPPRPNP